MFLPLPPRLSLLRGFLSTGSCPSNPFPPLTWVLPGCLDPFTLSGLSALSAEWGRGVRAWCFGLRYIFSEITWNRTQLVAWILSYQSALLGRHETFSFLQLTQRELCLPWTNLLALPAPSWPELCFWASCTDGGQKALLWAAGLSQLQEGLGLGEGGSVWSLGWWISCYHRKRDKERCLPQARERRSSSSYIKMWKRLNRIKY